MRVRGGLWRILMSGDWQSPAGGRLCVSGDGNFRAAAIFARSRHISRRRSVSHVDRIFFEVLPQLDTQAGDP